MKLNPGEYKLVDYTAPYRALTFPVLELVLITGLAWMGIGWLDVNNSGALPYPDTRNALVGLWAVLVVWRFLLPVLRLRRKRFVLTNQRIIGRLPGLTSRTDHIWLGDIVDIKRRRSGISVAVRGYERTIHFSDVPRAKKVESLIWAQLR